MRLIAREIKYRSVLIMVGLLQLRMKSLTRSPLKRFQLLIIKGKRDIIESVKRKNNW